MSTEPIRHEYLVRATPERAFDVYVNEIADWWTPAYTADPATFTAVRIEPHVGGTVVEEHSRGQDSYPWGEVTAWEPGVRLAYTSALAQDPLHPSEVTVTFVAEGPGTRVVFEHGGWTSANQAERAKFTEWPVILERYVTLVESKSAATAHEPPEQG